MPKKKEIKKEEVKTVLPLLEYDQLYSLKVCAIRLFQYSIINLSLSGTKIDANEPLKLINNILGSYDIENSKYAKECEVIKSHLKDYKSSDISKLNNTLREIVAIEIKENE